MEIIRIDNFKNYLISVILMSYANLRLSVVYVWMIGKACLSISVFVVPLTSIFVRISLTLWKFRFMRLPNVSCDMSIKPSSIAWHVYSQWASLVEIWLKWRQNLTLVLRWWLVENESLTSEPDVDTTSESDVFSTIVSDIRMSFNILTLCCLLK